MLLRFIKKRVRKITGTIPLNIFFVNMLFQRVLRIDSNCKYNKCYTSRIMSPEKLKIKGLKENSTVLKSLAVSGGCYIQASEGLIIGEGTIWSFNVIIVSQGHDLNDLSVIPKTRPIEIGKECWLGANSTILPGVTLGDKTVVAANSVVTKSFPDGYVVVGGVPAKVIRNLK